MSQTMRPPIARASHRLIRIRPLEQSLAGVAEHIHAVQMKAYAQEAELIGAARFPPLERTVEQVRSSREQFFGALVGEELLGVIAIEVDARGNRSVSSLVVAPEWQRQGLGRALLADVLRNYGSAELKVQTAARNGPAVSLYTSFGFTVVRRWAVGSPELELVRFRRPPSPSASVA